MPYISRQTLLSGRCSCVSSVVLACVRFGTRVCNIYRVYVFKSEDFKTMIACFNKARADNIVNNTMR